MKEKAKLRSKIVTIWGDYYYQETNPEETIEYCFQRIPKEIKDEKDLEKLINEDINVEMPLDKPQWRMYYQENYQDKYSCAIYKQHHSLGDGVTCMNFHIGMGVKFNNDALISLRPVSFFQRLLIRLSFIFYVPRLAMKLLRVRPEKHALHNGDRKLSGKKIAATSTDILFKDVKEAAKSKGVTINDFITSCLATGLK